MTLTAGRELDALVAEQVMGEKLIPDGHCDECRSLGGPIMLSEYGYGPPASYSTDIEAAWAVVEKLIAMTVPYKDTVMHRVVFTLEHHEVNRINGPNQWNARIMLLPEPGQWEDIDAATAPLAICLAALKAVGYEA